MKRNAPRQNLLLPTGTETLHLREASRHRAITRTMEEIFDLWGYQPAETPLVDFFDLYRHFLSEEDARSMYRTVDAQGEILAVRADTTLFLAKQLGLHLTAEELPVRIQYNQQIVRSEGVDDIASNEYQQAGVELVGIAGTDGDVEILLLLLETMNHLERQDAVVHVGSHRILQAVAQSLEVPPEALPTLTEAIIRRQPEAALSQMPEGIAALLRFIGSGEEFAAALGSWELPPAVRNAARELQERVDLASQLMEPRSSEPVVGSGDAIAVAPRIRVDMSELGTHPYYSGIAFSAYCSSGTAAVARGGRYDTLLAQFGFDAPSVGFSMYTRKLPPDTLARFVEPAPAAPESTGVRNLRERVAHQRAAHQQGKRMTL